jgi:S1-C subfamily serine protease
MTPRSALILCLALLLGIAAATATSSAAAPAHPLLADGPQSQAWNIDPAGEFVFTGDPGKSKVELLLSKAEIKAAASVTLSIQSDAKQLVFASGADSLTFSVSGDEVLVVMDLSGPRAKLTVGGAERVADRGKWIRMSGTPVPLRRELPQATYATVTVEDDEDPAVAAPTTQPLAPAAAAGATPMPAAPPLLAQPPLTENSPLAERLKRSVFKVDIRNKEGKSIGNGTGFLFDAKGNALTNFHVVKGQVGAKAIFPGREKEELDVELVEVYPDLDIAVIKVDLGLSQNLYQPLKLRPDPPPAGIEVWSVGFPMFGFTVNRGIVSGVRTHKDLPEQFRRDGIAPESTWVQTDCTINSGNSGGPLVNAAGEVIGINTWYSLLGNNAYFALASADAAKRVANLPAQPLTFAAAQKKYPATQRSPMENLPGELPELAMKETVQPTKVTYSARAFGKAFVKNCNRCNGRGWKGVKRLVGHTGDGRVGSVGSPIYANDRVVCETCAGRGVVPPVPQVLYNSATMFTKDLATLKCADSELQDVVVKARAAITDGIRNNPAGLVHITDRTKGVLALANVAVNQPIVGLGQVIASRATANGKGQIHAVILLNSPRVMLIADPVMSDPSLTGTVFLGGLNAGAVQIPGAEEVLVLRRGFVMAVDAVVDERQRQDQQAQQPPQQQRSRPPVPPNFSSPQSPQRYR